jgi:hypothetical protein
MYCFLLVTTSLVCDILLPITKGMKGDDKKKLRLMPADVMQKRGPIDNYRLLDANPRRV